MQSEETSDGELHFFLLPLPFCNIWRISLYNKLIRIPLIKTICFTKERQITPTPSLLNQTKTFGKENFVGKRKYRRIEVKKKEKRKLLMI